MANPGRPAPTRATPPRTPYEEAVHGIWADVLGTSAFGVHDDFFALGGHSMLAPRVVARIRRTLGVQIPVRDFFGCRTVAALAAVVADNASTESVRIEPQPDDAVPLLSFDEQRLWLESQLLPSLAYNVHGRRRLRGPLDQEAFEASLRVLLLRHETLRTRYPLVNGQPVPIVDDLDPQWRLELREPSGPRDPNESAGDASEERLLAALRLADEQATTEFALGRGPLFRCLLIRLADDDHLLAITAHHIVCDDWSVGLFTRELAALYSAQGDPERAGLGEHAISYRDYAAWQRDGLSGDRLTPALDYWRSQLSGAPTALALPAASRRIDVRRSGSLRAAELTRSETTAVRDLCRAHGATSFMICCAAFAALLGRWSGQSEVVIGVPLAGRTDPGTESLIGFLINMVPIRVDLSGEPTFAELVARVRQTCLDGYAQATVPLDVLVERLGVVRDPRRPPLFEVMLNVMNHVGGDGAELDGLTSSDVQPASALPSKYDLSLNLTESGQRLRLELHVNPDRFPAELTAAFGDQLVTLLRDALAEPDRLVTGCAVEPPPGVGRSMDTDQPSDSAPGHPEPDTESRRQPVPHPDRIAVVSAEGTCRYGDLDRQVRRIARDLSPTGHVGVVRRWSAGFVAAWSACVAAGVAYTLVEDDPTVPLSYMGVTETLDPPLGSGADPVGEPVHEPSDERVDDLAEMKAHGGAAGELARQRWGLDGTDRLAVATTRPGLLATGLAAALASGGTLLLPVDDDLEGWLRSVDPTVVLLTAVQLRSLAGPLPTVRRIVVEHDGDLLAADLRAARQVGPGARVSAVYRPDRDGRPRFSFEVPPDWNAALAPLRVPLGEPWPGAQPKLLGAADRLASIGEVAELCLGSYRTGDLVRRWPDDGLAPAGRVGDDPAADLLETAAELRELPEVSDALVVESTDADGQPVLIGYVAGPEPTEDAVALRQALGVRLPEHLLPRQLLVLAALPRTPAGEYDLDALPLPDLAAADTYVAPRTPFETELTAIFVELLGVERIGVHDTFFELNGFSLLATQLTARIRDSFAVELPLREVFASPTVAGLAHLILQVRAEQASAAELEALLDEVESLP